MRKIETKKTFDLSGNLIDQFSIISEFDDQDNMITKTAFDENDVKTFQEKYFYNNKIVIRCELYAEGALKVTKLYTYTKYHRLSTERWLISVDQIIYEYILNEAENTAIINEYDDNGSLTQTTKHILNAEYQIIEEIEADNYITKNKYDGENLILTQIFEEGKESLKEEYFFDEHGNEIKNSGIDYENEDEIIIEKTFNENNQILTEQQFMNGVLEFDKIFKYDIQNRLIEEIVKSDSEKEITEIVFQ